ncbi:MAG: hypothetical protein JSC189_000233 [Candidatus Tokpelaia sp. JSC189]|nr:MAG: hypothetical protein JSC189_000233 [Candidatus Tokpelaia sp. JSC189]
MKISYNNSPHCCLIKKYFNYIIFTVQPLQDCLMPMFYSITEWISQYGAWTYFPLIFLESMGLPLPGQTGLIAGSLLATHGKMNLKILLIASFTGGVLGNCTGYAIGLSSGRALFNKFARFLYIQEKQLQRFEKLLHEKGIWFIIGARFIAIARQVSGLIAGFGRMDFYRFMIANIIGTALWILVWGFGPYYLYTFV